MGDVTARYKVLFFTREPVKKAHKNGIVWGQSLGGTEQFLVD